jgi:hypothetical protein
MIYHPYTKDAINTCLYNLNNAPYWTEQFEQVCIGLGALLTGFGGLKIIIDWLQQKQLKRKVSRFYQKYPIDQLNKDYLLVDTKNVPGKWWLIDKRTLKKHWIRNLETARDMGWTYSMVKHVADRSLNKYEVGENINTRELK